MHRHHGFFKITMRQKRLEQLITHQRMLTTILEDQQIRFNEMHQILNPMPTTLVHLIAEYEMNSTEKKNFNNLQEKIKRDSEYLSHDKIFNQQKRINRR